MFDEVKKNFGFGCMRLPMNGEQVDDEQFKAMADAFIEAGFNYFDTAHGYLDGESEKALKRCLTSRYPRDAYILTNKLTEPYFNSPEEVRTFFEEQLELCGADYFDFYLMHAQNAKNFEHFKKNQAYETAFELKKEGKVKHVGISFHDTPEVLEEILSTYPEIEVVQLQFNYLDYEDPAVQSKACYDVAVKHGKKVIVMEPVKGGALADLPPAAEKVLADLNGGSPASYAIRFVAGHPEVFMTLSGMSSSEQMEDNLSFMKDFEPLSQAEEEAVGKVRDIFNEADLIGCTGCSYCTAGCPQQIAIPQVFRAENSKRRYLNSQAKMRWDAALKEHGDPADCIQCGQCEHICPQNLPIIELLQEAVTDFKPID